MSIKKRSDPKYIRAYERGMLRSAFVSLFWGIISEKKKTGTFTFQALAKSLGKNKGEVSRWFNGEPNWTINTIAGLADALNVDLQVIATDKITGQVFTASGIQRAITTSFIPAHRETVAVENAVPTGRPIFRKLPDGVTVVIPEQSAA